MCNGLCNTLEKCATGRRGRLYVALSRNKNPSSVKGFCPPEPPAPRLRRGDSGRGFAVAGPSNDLRASVALSLSIFLRCSEHPRRDIQEPGMPRDPFVRV